MKSWKSDISGISDLHGDGCGDGVLPSAGGGDGDGEDGEEQGHHGGDVTVQLTMKLPYLYRGPVMNDV